MTVGKAHVQMGACGALGLVYSACSGSDLALRGEARPMVPSYVCSLFLGLTILCINNVVGRGNPSGHQTMVGAERQPTA